MQKIELPVAFFDSGLGGISVLREAVRLLPQEDYLYFGDSLHAPYGVKSVEEVVRLSLENTAMLTARGIKALVVACNTATSAAISILREHYPELPIIGTEPALKPAVERHTGGRILVMATAVTVAEKKFNDLRRHYQQDAEIIPLACSGLMEFVERGELHGPALEAYLHQKLDPYLKDSVDAIVLGCTHYPFLAGAIRRVVGERPEIMDGSHGIALQLRRRLEEQGLQRPAGRTGSVTFLNSLDSPELLALSERLLHTEGGMS